MDLHPDLKDLLSAFAAAGVEYLIGGGYAVAFHGRPRFTKDLDVSLGETPDNLERAALALERFGAPDVAVDGLRGAGLDDIVWLGAPPPCVWSYSAESRVWSSPQPMLDARRPTGPECRRSRSASMT